MDNDLGLINHGRSCRCSLSDMKSTLECVTIGRFSRYLVYNKRLFTLLLRDALIKIQRRFPHATTRDRLQFMPHGRSIGCTMPVAQFSYNKILSTLQEEERSFAMSNLILPLALTGAARGSRVDEARRNVFIYLDFDYLSLAEEVSLSGTTYRAPPIIQVSRIVSSAGKRRNVSVHTTPRFFRIRAFLPVVARNVFPRAGSSGSIEL